MTIQAERDVLRVLLLKFGEKLFLLEGSAAAQQFEQRILHVFGCLYGQRGAAGRAGLEAAELAAPAPALAANASVEVASSTSASTTLSCSSFSASSGATSRSFSAACWSISIC